MYYIYVIMSLKIFGTPKVIHQNLFYWKTILMFEYHDAGLADIMKMFFSF